MPVASPVRLLAKKTLTVCLVCLLGGAGFAQQSTTQGAPAHTADQNPPLTPLPQAPAPQKNAHLYSDQDYTKPQSQFPNLVAQFGRRRVTPPNLTNSARVDSMFRDGKMYLSLNDAIALALENNLDIAIQRYNLSIADADILRTKSGAATLGVNAGLVSGTPGGMTGTTSAGGTGSTTTGSTGGGAGGTTVGVGGAGAGAAGIVESTTGEGPTIDSFDPVITGTITEEHAVIPESNTIITGTATLVQNTTTANFAYTQGFATGTALTTTFDNTRMASNSQFSIVDPSITPSFRFQLRQHLLQGFGFDPNLRYIRIARNNREIADITFRNQIMTTVSQIENIYWDLVNAYENVKVNERALELANKTLSDDEKQVAIGTLAPITVVQAKSAVATAKQNLIVSQTNLQLEQLLMKNAITRNMADPILAVAPVIPTDTLDLDAQYEVRPVEDLVREALERRPEIAQSRIDLRNREISRKSVRNLMFPSVDVYAFYGASALAGDQNALSTEGIGPNCRGGSTSGFSQCYPPGFWPFPPNGTSYSSAFKNLFNSSFPDKGVGVNISIPLRNRQAQADQVRSELEYRQAQMALQQQENTITLQVRQAQFAVQQNYAALQAALAAQEYAQQSLVAEQKRFSLGASTTTLVLQMSSNLATAESNTLAAASNYQKSKVQLDLYTAATLTKLGIDIGDAEAGKVQRVPHVPGIVPQQNDQQGIPQQLQQQQQNPSAPPSQANPPQTTTPPQQ